MAISDFLPAFPTFPRKPYDALTRVRAHVTRAQGFIPICREGREGREGWRVSVMLTGLNRVQRRQAARRWAEPLARSCLHSRHGKITAIPPGERAVKVLARAFEQMLRSGEPAVLRLSPAEALAFPGADGEAAGAVESWLAVGLDVEQRAAYCMRHVEVGQPCVDQVAKRRAVERLMLDELARVCRTPGLDGHPLPTAKWDAQA